MHNAYMYMYMYMYMIYQSIVKYKYMYITSSIMVRTAPLSSVNHLGIGQ